LTLLSAVPTGTNIQVPSQNVLLDQTKGDVAKDPIGDFVVVFEELTGAGNRDIFARRYSANGTPKGAEFAVISTALDQSAPRVGMAGDGSFVVVWQEVDAGGDSNVFFRRFDSAGNAVSLPTIAHPADPVDQTNPDVAVFPTGPFAVTWDNATTAGNSDIQFRRFLANGSPLDPAARNLANTSRNETQGRVAAGKAIGAASFTVVWTEVSDRGDTDVRHDLRSFFTGDTISGSDVVSDDAVNFAREHFNPSVDMDVAGNSVVTYTEEVSSSNRDIFLRRYDTTGNPSTAEPQVVEDQATVDTMVHEVGVSGNGNFVVSYVIENGTAATSDLSYQRFADDGTKFAGPQDPLSPPLEPGNQTAVNIAMNAAGDFTIVWQDDVFAGVFGQLVFARNFRNPLDTIGLYDPTSATYFLRNSNTTGVADIPAFNFGANVPTRWIPFAGDWNGDGIKTIGVYEPTGASFFLRNTNSSGTADVAVNFGVPGWIPIAGDWDGDGIDTIGAFDPASALFYLRNSNTSGVADIEFRYGPGTLSWRPVVGDWNGDGIDTVGLYNPSRGIPRVGRFLLRNSNTTGQADVAFNFNSPNLKPLSGDWNRDGVDTIGTIDPTTAIVSLRNSNSGGGPDIQFTYGVTAPPLTEAWVPVVGDWNGPGGAGLVATTFAAADTNTAATLDDTALEPIVGEAIARWEMAGLSAEQAASLAQVSIVVDDLTGNQLGLAHGNQITLDNDAAGHGWFADLSPENDDEFVEIAGELIARTDGEAAGRIDLLSVVSHEFGHLLGLQHSPEDSNPADVMHQSLRPGLRRTPEAAALDYLLG